MNLEAKKIALRMIASGLYIITSRRGDDTSAATVSWLNQASFQPPLVMMGIKKDSHTHALLDASKICAIHFLGREQKHLAEAFFKPTQHAGNKINGLEFETKVTGAPILKNVPAYVECKIVGKQDGGDHDIFIAEVVEAEVRENIPSLGMRDTPWHYGG